MLYTKCILSPIEERDGTRISVMSRHTLNDGTTPDLRITPDRYREWRREFAPPERLIGDYYKRGLSWEVFEDGYLAYLRSFEMIPKVQQLTRRATLEDLTLLCIENTPEHCHRRLLAEECLRYEPKLNLEHR